MTSAISAADWATKGAKAVLVTTRPGLYNHVAEVELANVTDLNIVLPDRTRFLLTGKLTRTDGWVVYEKFATGTGCFARRYLLHSAADPRMERVRALFAVNEAARAAQTAARRASVEFTDRTVSAVVEALATYQALKSAYTTTYA